MYQGMLSLEITSVVCFTHTTVPTIKSIHFRMVKSYDAGTTPYSLLYPQQRNYSVTRWDFLSGTHNEFESKLCLSLGIWLPLLPCRDTSTSVLRTSAENGRTCLLSVWVNSLPKSLFPHTLRTVMISLSPASFYFNILKNVWGFTLIWLYKYIYYFLINQQNIKKNLIF